MAKKGQPRSSLVKRFLHLEREDEPYLSAKRERTPTTDRVAALEDGHSTLPEDLPIDLGDTQRERMHREIEEQQQRDHQRQQYEMRRQEILARDARRYQQHRARTMEEGARRQRTNLAIGRLLLRVGVPLLILWRIAAC